MVWLRLHTDILADPKLMRASREGAKYLHLTPWLLAFAKQADDGGRLSVGNLPAEPRDIAAMIPCVTTIQVRNCQKELRAIGVLIENSDGVLQFSRWEPRQSKPSASPEAVRTRMRNSRHRKEVPDSYKVEDDPSVTPHSAERRGVTVTPPEERRGEEKRREEKGVTKRDPKAGAPDGAPDAETPGLSAQDLHDRKERAKAQIREMQASEGKT